MLPTIILIVMIIMCILAVKIDGIYSFPIFVVSGVFVVLLAAGLLFSPIDVRNNIKEFNAIKSYSEILPIDSYLYIRIAEENK